MTRRGFWFLAIAGGGLIVAVVLPEQFSIAFLSLAALVWFTLQWSVFQWRSDVVARRMTIQRRINGDESHRVTLWKDEAAHVTVRIEPSGWFGLPRVRAIDRIPIRTNVKGEWEVRGACTKSSPLLLAYDMRPHVAGELRFEGVLLEVSDRAGFFEARIFLRRPDVVTVLPRLVASDRARPEHKRLNRLAAHGVHRHLRPGSGSELLNLRDYQMGDPPKQIAWKVSARRDQLTTKEYESDVPIRCNIFIDRTDSVRVGWPGQTTLEQSVQLAAALARRLLEQGDPVGLCLFDDVNIDVLPAARGKRHETRLIGKLCQVATEPPGPTDCPIDRLIEPAYRACGWIYPELLNPRINRRYRWQEWGTNVWQMRPWFALTIGAMSVGAAVARWGMWGIIASICAVIVVAIVAISFFLFRRRRGPRRPRLSQRLRRHRKQVASVVAAVRRLDPAHLALMIDHDETFSIETQRFMIEHRANYPRPLYDTAGRYVFHRPGKLMKARQALLRAVAHARDNEMFVLLIDLFEFESDWQPLFDAIKVARGRHHDVTVVASWPAEFAMPTPDSVEPGTDKPPESSALIKNTLIQKYFRSHQLAKRELGKLGVAFLLSSLSETTETILRRVETLRLARIPSRHS